MITREVTLHHGIKFDGEPVKTVTIREETVGDQAEVLASGITGQLLDLRIRMRRVKRIGALQDPTPEIVAKLTQTDWEIVVRAMDKMDMDEAIAAGLVKPEADADRGREEPGGDTPGTA